MSFIPELLAHVRSGSEAVVLVAPPKRPLSARSGPKATAPKTLAECHEQIKRNLINRTEPVFHTKRILVEKVGCAALTCATELGAPYGPE